MARLIKILLVFAAGFAGVVVIAAVALFLFFDPNDFRERIAAEVKETTGRDLRIAGDLSLSIFPWLAVDVGRTEMGNAEGFSDEIFLSFDEARLSVQLMPLLLQQDVRVGGASLDGLNVNLEVLPDGRNNWDDLSESDAENAGATDSAGGASQFDVANVTVSDARLSYTDRQAGSAYAFENLSIESGRIAADTPIPLQAAFDFSSDPGALGGHIEMRTTASFSDAMTTLGLDGLNVGGTLNGVVDEPTEFNLDSRAIAIDTNAKTMSPGELDLTVLGVAVAANVAPFSYEGTPTPTATLRVAEFSLKELMERVGTVPPVTANPDALTRVSLSADATLGETAIALTNLSLDLDASTMSGELSVPTADAGAMIFDLEVDEVALDDYMAPADAGADAAGADNNADIEIPAELIRSLQADGSVTVKRATLSGMQFENLVLGVKSAGGKMRLNPLRAEFFDGSYSGDVQIDASGDTPSISANETIAGVNLSALAKSLFDQDNISGTIEGNFALTGAGQTLADIRRNLDGNIAMQLADGAWEGTDVWYQIRRARAMFRQEVVPEPELPARTEFSSVKATGVVTDGVFANDDFMAELPFLQLTGRGTVDLVSTGVDYALDVRVLERPELMADATEEELADFTETVVPLKVTGLMASPSVKPDIEGIFKAQVDEAIEEKKQELKDDLMNRLLGGDDESGSAGEVPDGEEPEETEEDPEEALKKKLLDKLF